MQAEWDVEKSKCVVHTTQILFPCPGLCSSPVKSALYPPHKNQPQLPPDFHLQPPITSKYSLRQGTNPSFLIHSLLLSSSSSQLTIRKRIGGRC